MNQIGNSFTSIEQVTSQYLNTKSTISNSKTVDETTSFSDILKQKMFPEEQVSSLKFSKHAAMRLDDRNIHLSPQQSQRLEAGVQKASEKGINESLVMLDSMAFIVNVPNQTVVTAMDSNESAEKVFTNIDGAVIA